MRSWPWHSSVTGADVDRSKSKCTVPPHDLSLRADRFVDSMVRVASAPPEEEGEGREVEKSEGRKGKNKGIKNEGIKDEGIKKELNTNTTREVEDMDKEVDIDDLSIDGIPSVPPPISFNPPSNPPFNPPSLPILDSTFDEITPVLLSLIHI